MCNLLMKPRNPPLLTQVCQKLQQQRDVFEPQHVAPLRWGTAAASHFHWHLPGRDDETADSVSQSNREGDVTEEGKLFIEVLSQDGMS